MPNNLSNFINGAVKTYLDVKAYVSQGLQVLKNVQKFCGHTSWETATAQSSCTSTSSVSNYDRYLLSLLREIGEGFNDTVITEVKVGGVVNRSEKMLRSQICQDIRTVHFL